MLKKKSSMTALRRYDLNDSIAEKNIVPDELKQNYSDLEVYDIQE